MCLVSDRPSDRSGMQKKVHQTGGCVRRAGDGFGVSLHVICNAVPSSSAQLWRCAGPRCRGGQRNIRTDAGTLF
jgi:hypothetical protein